MSYSDPYAHHGQYAQQTQYQDAPFNPYEVQHGAGGYEQTGYEHAGQNYAQQGYGGGYTDDASGQAKEQPRSEFDHDEGFPPAMGAKCVPPHMCRLMCVG